MNQKIKYSVKIKLSSNDFKILDQSVIKLIKAIKDDQMEVSGPIPLPVKSVNFATRRAPNIYKNSFEKFKYCIHKRLIFIKNINNIEKLKCIGQVVIPQTIDVKVNFIKI